MPVSAIPTHVRPPRHKRGHGLGLGLALAGVIAAFGGTVTTVCASTNEVTAHAGLDWDKERAFWAFQSPRPQPIPAVSQSEWPRQPLDRFVLAGMERQGLKPSAPADRVALLRRATFDLTGLPPTPDAVERFVRSTRPDAWQTEIDRLLASPAFGERLASVWMPLVRYAEDQAHQVGDDTTYFYPNAWKYRQWVIQAFNRDLPYDQFIRFQLAADRFSAATDADQAALGLLGLGPKYYDRGRLEVQAEEWEDRVDTVCRTMLGLTVACARCHDHKFEPITTTDYYALAGIFASTRMVNQRPDGFIEKDNTPASRLQPDTLHVVREGSPKDLPVFLRGNVSKKGPIAERRFLQILGDDSTERFVDGSGRRELAMAIASPGNPLTARVWVNRMWAEFFGKPLVATPSNFGHSGSRPTHPELLDDLAVRFVQNRWSVKSLLREFVLSATYQQSTPHSAANASGTAGPALADASKDPDNTWLSHMPRRRLSVEQWRDALLFVAGDLSPTEGHSRELSDANNASRTVYGRISRLKLDDTLMQFDYPDANVHAEKRSTTTTAMQKLFVLNHPFMLGRAESFARRSRDAAGPETEARIGWMYAQAFGRQPSEQEMNLGRKFIDSGRADAARAWQQYAQVLLGANEFQYLD